MDTNAPLSRPIKDCRLRFPGSEEPKRPADVALPTAPKDADGRFVKIACPECGNGSLRFEGNGHWRCDGLADPGHPNKPLIACTYTRQDGEAASAD